MKIIEKIVDVTTGEETVTEREETAEETKTRIDWEKHCAELAAKQVSKDAAKAELLAKLGITAEEAALLLA